MIAGTNWIANQASGKIYIIGHFSLEMNQNYIQIQFDQLKHNKNKNNNNNNNNNKCKRK